MSNEKIEAHKTIGEYCCACDYDQVVFDRRIKQALESQMSELRKEVEKKRQKDGGEDGYGNPDIYTDGYNSALDEVLLLMNK